MGDIKYPSVSYVCSTSQPITSEVPIQYSTIIKGNEPRSTVPEKDKRIYIQRKENQSRKLKTIKTTSFVYCFHPNCLCVCALLHLCLACNHFSVTAMMISWNPVVLCQAPSHPIKSKPALLGSMHKPEQFIFAFCVHLCKLNLVAWMFIQEEPLSTELSLRKWGKSVYVYF